MDGIPVRARVYVFCAAVGALCCLLPLLTDRTPWWPVLLLAALYACGERVDRRRFAGTLYPVLLAGAFLFPAAAAALVPLPGALLSRVDHGPAPLRRVWRAARLALPLLGFGATAGVAAGAAAAGAGIPTRVPPFVRAG